jgi:hypothetical protein
MRAKLLRSTSLPADPPPDKVADMIAATGGGRHPAASSEPEPNDTSTGPHKAKRKQQRASQDPPQWDPRWDDEVLTVAEAAQQLGLSKFTLVRMREAKDSGGLRWVQLTPGRIGYRRGDIRQYLLDRRSTGTENAA